MNALGGAYYKEYYLGITLHLGIWVSIPNIIKHCFPVHEAEQTAWRHLATSGEQLWRQQAGAGVQCLLAGTGYSV